MFSGSLVIVVVIKPMWRRIFQKFRLLYQTVNVQNYYEKEKLEGNNGFVTYKISNLCPENLGVGRTFSRSGPLMDFSKSISTEGQKWWNLFFPTRNKENNLFLQKISKSKGCKVFPFRPFRHPCWDHKSLKWTSGE